jgi:hypothetical protein
VAEFTNGNYFPEMTVRTGKKLPVAEVVILPEDGRTESFYEEAKTVRYISSEYEISRFAYLADDQVDTFCISRHDLFKSISPESMIQLHQLSTFPGVSELMAAHDRYMVLHGWAMTKDRVAISNMIAKEIARTQFNYEAFSSTKQARKLVRKERDKFFQDGSYRYSTMSFTSDH